MARRTRHPGPAGLLLLLFAAAGAGCAEREEPAVRDVLVRVDRIAIDDHDVPVVVLEEEGGTRWLPIWIGTAEARSIALEMEAKTSPRPNTHDLARSLIRGLDASVARVVVTELRDGTYYAILGIALGDRTVEIDARPSDAIAIALRDGAPIFVREGLFERAGAADEPSADDPGREI
jgi:bifunctional DNase/RNase